MVKINYLFFGYRKLRVDPSDLSGVTSILLRNSLLSVINNDGTITVKEGDFKKIQEILSGRIDFEYSEPLGFPGVVKRTKHKSAILVSVVLTALIVIFLSDVIWDVRVEGNEILTDGDIVLALSEEGFEIGDLWGKINKSRVETSFLQNNKNISWININRRGSVAYVKVIESDVNQNNTEEIKGYSNIVASSDCVIEEITVKRGTAVVKPGDVVKKGDLLVAGVLPAESGGGFCYAEAGVVGRVSDTLSVQIDRNTQKLISNEKKLYSLSLNFFKISINIFKLYGNLTKEYDIIENEISYSLFDKYKLPLSITAVYILKPVFADIEYSDEELTRIASERLNSLMMSRLHAGDLLKMKTYGEFTNAGYSLSTDIIFLCEVGQRVELDVEK